MKKFNNISVFIELFDPPLSRETRSPDKKPYLTVFNRLTFISVEAFRPTLSFPGH